MTTYHTNRTSPPAAAARRYERVRHRAERARAAWIRAAAYGRAAPELRELRLELREAEAAEEAARVAWYRAIQARMVQRHAEALA